MRVRYIILSAAALCGCTALLGSRDVYLDPSSDNGNPDGGDTDGRATNDATTGDGDSGTCVANLDNDSAHCGRCFHDCAGGTCSGGKCAPVLLAQGLPNPDGLVLSATDIYVAGLGGVSAIMRVPRAGGAVTTIVSTAADSARGVALDGNTLYWSNATFASDDAGAFGGIWKCTIPACTDQTLLRADWTLNPIIASNFIFYATGNTDDRIFRMPKTGGAALPLVQSDGPFALAADSTHVYFTNNESPALHRVLFDGGSKEGIGPGSEQYVGYVALDADRVYWAYEDNTSQGHVLSALKSNPSTTTSYGTGVDNISPIGVAVDDTYVYWSSDGNAMSNTPAGDGKIQACPKTGCVGAPIVLANDLKFSGPIVADGNAIYWVEFGAQNTTTGRLRKVAKP